ncbi:phenazine biosynthesis, PhzF family protein [Collimonas arenae]|uniref:Phenazine biosynthesis, PhzF family protein n=1 Tax=Collimonas arenae TaxID=279058 RepID=A0A127PMG3_9BURK|nr:PhzF family phenazine biosynthesis protein [Collimonas arenae]AMO98933.1 phenazine biosynthesis, PhzF family protein [Collimonas arenae]AMP08828.1 phenazine biosynthesis, PhzF family protein [Collimonas arenae]
MASYAYRLLNVFAESTFSGNQLCVFEDARGLDAPTMQALALQFNLSETTFILPSDRADARVRIFTPGHEMRFAGHPTLGTAHVVRDLARTGPTLSLELNAGVVPVSAEGDIWTLTAPGQPKTAAADLTQVDMAALLGLNENDLLAAPLWVDTGTDQMLVALRSLDAVRRTRPDSSRLDAWPQNSIDRKTVYVFAFDTENPGRILSRYFYAKPGGGVVEDPGTGSACANLGGWLLAHDYTLPLKYQVEQGAAVQRPCLLRLAVTTERTIQVGGKVIEIGRGNITL